MQFAQKIIIVMLLTCYYCNIIC